MISVFSFPDGSSLVNKVWSPSVSLSSLYRIDGKLHVLSENEFSNVLEQQQANAIGCYSVDVHTEDVIEHRIGCSGSFNLFLGSERFTICFTTEKVSRVFIEKSINSEKLSLLSKIDPSCLATDYYGLSRGIRPLSTLCFDDFKVSLYNDLGAGLDLKCNYVLMQDEQEIGYFGAKLSGGTLNPIPVTAKGLRQYMLSQNSRKLPIKSDSAASSEDFGIVRVTSAVSRAKAFFEDIRAGNEVSTGSWMNLVYMPDQNFFSRPTANLVGVRACNSESVAKADEIILEASVSSTVFAKLAVCVAQALGNNNLLATTSVNMLLIINSNEFDSLLDKLRLQKETFKRAVDQALTKLVTDAQDSVKLELDKPWSIPIKTTIDLPRGMPVVDQDASFEELGAANAISDTNGSKLDLSFDLDIPSLSQCFSFPVVSASNRESALKKFGKLYDIKTPDFSKASETELVTGISSLISTEHVRERVSSVAAQHVADKVKEALKTTLDNVVTTLSFNETDLEQDRVKPTCNGKAATEVGWMSQFHIGPFPGEWHVDVSMPDYAMYSQDHLEPEGREYTMSGGGLWTHAGESSYSFPLKRFKKQFPVSAAFDLKKVNSILEEHHVDKRKDLPSACYVPAFMFNPRVSVISAEKQDVQLELHFGYAGCPVPILSSLCTNINSLNSELLTEKIKDLHNVIIKPLGSSYQYCLLSHHEEKTFGSTPGCWFDTRARTVHVGYTEQVPVTVDKIVSVTHGSNTEFSVQKETHLEWVNPYAVAPYFYYEVIVPIKVNLSDLDNKFVADSQQERRISEMLSAVGDQAEFLVNASNLKEIVKVMAQTNNYKELKLLGATEKSLLNPEMAANFTDLNISDSSRLCSALLGSLRELREQWKDIFEPGTPGAPTADSDCYKNLTEIINHLSEALKDFSCKNPPVFFSASQVNQSTKIFDGGSINLLLV